LEKPLVIDCPMDARKGKAKWAFSPVEIGTKEQKFLENVKSAA